MGTMAAVVTLSGCAGPLSFFGATGDQAARIEVMGWVLILGFGVIWVAMIALGLAVMIWPHRFARFSQRAWLIWGGLVLPSVVMVPLFIWAVVETEVLRRYGDDTRVIRAEAFMWGWEFTYPEAPGRPTRDLLYLPADEPVVIEIRSRDVIHSLWIPQLAGKMDAVPGHVTTLPLTARQPGLIEGQCAEFCGLRHTEMRFVVDVQTGDAHAAAMAGLTDGTTPVSPDALDMDARAAVRGALQGATP